MMDVSRLGGGYADSLADASATVTALLECAQPGSAASRLVVVAGPPGSGKSALGARLLEEIPGSLHLDKDWTAAGFILSAAKEAGIDEARAYGWALYWSQLRPQEYAGALRTACANLVGRRVVLLSGGWGPELAVTELWEGLAARIAPSQLVVMHLDPPPLKTWRARLEQRGTRFDSDADFARFAAAVCQFDIWADVIHLDAGQSPSALAQTALTHLFSATG